MLLVCALQKYSKKRQNDLTSFAGLILYVVYTSHLMACIWLKLGMLNECNDGAANCTKSWVYAEGFDEAVSQGESPRHLSKEFVREWLMSKGFQGREGDVMPVMEDEDLQLICDRYMELYETMLGRPFQEESMDNLQETINSFLLH